MVDEIKPLCVGKEKCAEYLALQAENKQLSEEIGWLRGEIHRLNPPHKHDHDYFHEDCGLCQIEKSQYEPTRQALESEVK